MIKGKIFLALATVTLGTTQLPAADQPNVLFIAVDDLRPELGCYGVEEIKTPHIDDLAASGVVFNRAYCQLAVCNPSRVSLLTGLRPDSSKVWDLVTRFRETVPDIITLPQQFKQHGYHTVSYGKIFHNPWPDDVSWSEPHRWPERSSLWSAEAKRRRDEFKAEKRTEGRPKKRVDRIRAQATEIVDIPDDKHIDGAIAVQSLTAMKRLAKQDKPFFLAAGFVRPHLPFVVPRRYWELYEAGKIPSAQNPFLPKDAPAFAMNTMYELRDYYDFDGTPSPREGSLTKEQQQRLKHGYYASVSFIDTLIGRLLRQLETLGLARNTIVVLWGDHGWKLGEHNSWCKQSNYEIDTRVPLIIRAPTAVANGKSTEALVEFIDIYPTLCELADVPAPEHLEGRSLTPLLSNSKHDWQHAAFSQFRRQNGKVPLMGYAMRTDRYRYVEWQDRRTRNVVARELYDHQRDPAEDDNVAGDAENKLLLKDLSQQLWATLPQPPKYETPKPLRPQVTFRNAGKTPLTLYWIRPDGTEQKSAVIEPRMQASRGTTIGHRFRIRGADGFSKVFRVSKQNQTFQVSGTSASPADVK